jgi:hypothetical protein
MGLIFVWVDPARAFSISFIESTNETSNIGVTTVDLTNVVQGARAEIATVAGTLPGVSITSAIFARIGLTEPGTGLLSDIVLVGIAPTLMGVTVISATFVSDPETALPLPMLALTASIPETGLEQVVFSVSLPRAAGGSVDLTVTAQSDFTPVPEPSMGILIGITGVIGLGGLLWRRSRRS